MDSVSPLKKGYATASFFYAPSLFSRAPENLKIPVLLHTGFLTVFKESCSSLESSLLTMHENLGCAVCFLYLRDPVLTICGHRFCEKCLSKWLNEHDNRCPIDNNPLGPTDIFPDNYTKREIAGISITCPNDGCFVSVPLLDFEDHFELCKFKGEGQKNSVHECRYKNVGCDFKATSPIDIIFHEKNDLLKHGQLFVLEFNKLSEDFRNCQSHCPGCHENGDRAECLKEKLPYYMNDVYVKLTELDQRTQENSIQLNNMNSQINVLLSKSTVSPERKNGQLLWKVENFDGIITKMQKNPNFSVYSPSFTTGEMGYKFRMRLFWSHTTQNALALYIHVEKGEHDFILKWPFEGQIAFSIIHPIDSNLRLQSTMRTNGSEAFHRPILQINNHGFGFSKITLAELNQQGFVRNDQLIIVVTVKSQYGS